MTVEKVLQWLPIAYWGLEGYRFWALVIQHTFKLCLIGDIQDEDEEVARCRWSRSSMLLMVFISDLVSTTVPAPICQYLNLQNSLLVL
mgnify:CR=1 FL=1